MIALETRLTAASCAMRVWLDLLLVQVVEGEPQASAHRTQQGDLARFEAAIVHGDQDQPAEAFSFAQQRDADPATRRVLKLCDLDRVLFVFVACTRPAGQEAVCLRTGGTTYNGGWRGLGGNVNHGHASIQAQ